MKASKSIKSKQILLSALVALVLIAGYYRWTKDSLTETLPVAVDTLPESENKSQKDTETKSETEKTTAEEEKADYFEKSRYERDLARSEAIAVLNQMSEENQSDETRRKNEKEISDNIKKTQQETSIENLIISKGFKNCVVFIEDSAVNVVVKADKLDSKSANQIKDIVLSQTDFKASQIRISNKAE